MVPWQYRWVWLPGIHAWLSALFLCHCLSAPTYEIWRLNSSINKPVCAPQHHLWRNTCEKNAMHLKTFFIPGLNFSSDVTTFSQKKTIKRAMYLWNHSQPSVLSSKVNSNSTSFQLYYSLAVYILKNAVKSQKASSQPLFQFFCIIWRISPSWGEYAWSTGLA